MIDERKHIKNKVVTFSLPDRTLIKIKEIADKNNITKSMAIRISVDKYKD